MVELTSGNTGTGLAIVCGIKGYPFVAVMSRGNSIERARMMSALGAEVVLVDQLPGSIPGQVSGGDLALVEESRSGSRPNGARSGPTSSACPATSAPTTCTPGRRFSASPAAGSTSSVISRARAVRSPGAPRRSRSTIPPSNVSWSSRRARRCWRVSRPANPGHRIQGGGYAMPDLPLLRPEHIDGYLKVSDEEAILAARQLAREEGIFAGFSSGANVAAALRLLAGACQGKTVAVLVNDSGLKYLSTDLWENLP